MLIARITPTAKKRWRSFSRGGCLRQRVGRKQHQQSHRDAVIVAKNDGIGVGLATLQVYPALLGEFEASDTDITTRISLKRFRR